MSDVHMEVDGAGADQANTDPPPLPEDKTSDPLKAKGKATAKLTPSLVRESGKSLLPISRVQKIIKADKVRPPARSTCKTPSLTLI